MFDRPWNLAFALGFGTRHVYSAKTEGATKKASEIDGAEKFLLPLVMIGSLLLPLLYLATPWLGFADYILPTWVHALGAATLALALWLFRRSHADLGLNWSISLELREGHQLIQDGVYRRIRHPMYTAIFLFSIAQGLLLANWLAGWVAFASFFPLYLVRVPKEEQLMLREFGEDYKQYMKRSGRLLPGLGGP